MRIGALSIILLLQVMLTISLQEPVTSLQLQKLSYFSTSATASNARGRRDISDSRVRCKVLNNSARSSSSSSSSPARNIAISAHSAGSTEVDDSFSSWTPFSGLIKDMKRRMPHYKSDWIDGIRKRTIGASLFLYFACLAQ